MQVLGPRCRLEIPSNSRFLRLNQPGRQASSFPEPGRQSPSADPHTAAAKPEGPVPMITRSRTWVWSIGSLNQGSLRFACCLDFGAQSCLGRSLLVSRLRQCGNYPTGSVRLDRVQGLCSCMGVRCASETLWSETYGPNLMNRWAQHPQCRPPPTQPCGEWNPTLGFRQSQHRPAEKPTYIAGPVQSRYLAFARALKRALRPESMLISTVNSPEPCTVIRISTALDGRKISISLVTTTKNGTVLLPCSTSTYHGFIARSCTRSAIRLISSWVNFGNICSVWDLLSGRTPGLLLIEVVSVALVPCE